MEAWKTEDTALGLYRMEPFEESLGRSSGDTIKGAKSIARWLKARIY
jgi:hypothetical protein